MQNNVNQQSAIAHAFRSGYSNASLALSQVIAAKTDFNNFHSGTYVLSSDHLDHAEYKNQSDSYILLTTELFGEITGKSYFLITDGEFEVLTKSIPTSKDKNVKLDEEFIKELDNILSAAVITKLSNELNRKVYGNIPLLIGKVKGRIDDIIQDDFSEEAHEVYINSVFFDLQDHPEIKPLFIWVLDSGIEYPPVTQPMLQLSI